MHGRHIKTYLALSLLLLILFGAIGFIINGWELRQTLSVDFITYIVKRPFVELYTGINASEFYLTHASYVTVGAFKRLRYKDKEAVLERLVEEKGSIEAREFLLRAYPFQPSSLHDVGHIIGEGIYREFGDSALGVCDSTFSFSCYHGAIVGFLREHGLDQAAIEKFAYNGCSKEPSRDDFYGCYHGLGHALMVVNANNMPSALSDCDKYVSDEELLSFCYQGVAMENAQGSFSADIGKMPYLRDDNPFYPCSIIGEQYQATCYSEHIAHAARLFENDWEKIARYCATLPNTTEEVKEMCFWRLGVSAEAESEGDAKEIVQACSYESKYTTECITGYARQRALAKDLVKAEEGCSFLDGNKKETCLKIIHEVQVLP